MNVLQNERGAAMLVALGILMMIGLIGAAVVQTSSTDMTIVENYQHDLRSFYAAEAGLEHAYSILRDTVGWRDGFTDEPVAGGSYTVTLVDSATVGGLDDTIVVTSTGMYSGATSIVEVRFATVRPFQWALFSDSLLKTCGSVATDSYNSDSGSYTGTVLLTGGDIGSNGYIDICGNADINGSAMTSSPGQMDISGSAYVSGDTSTTAAVRIFDPVPQSEIDQARSDNAAPAGLSGTFTYSAGSGNLTVKPNKTVTMAAGVYYFNDFAIRGTIQPAPGELVKIYIVGDALFNSQSRVNPGGKPGDLQIFSVGDDITINAGAEMYAVIYAPDVEFKLTGHADIYGALIGKLGKGCGTSHFHYDRALGNLSLDNNLEKISWREL